MIDQPEDIYLCIDGSWRVTLQLSIQHGYTQTETEMSCLKTEMSLTMNFLPVYTTAVPGYNHQLLVLVQHTVFASDAFPESDAAAATGEPAAGGDCDLRRTWFHRGSGGACCSEH